MLREIWRSGREGALGTERGGQARTIVIIELTHAASLLLFDLHGAHATNSLLPLNAFLLAGLQYLFVFDAEFATLDIETIQSDNDRVCISRLTKISESQATEGSLLIEMIIESVRCRDGK